MLSSKLCKGPKSDHGLDMKWPTQHAIAGGPQGEFSDPIQAASCLWYDTLPPRSRDVLARLPRSTPFLLDIGQSISRTPGSQEHVQCLTSKWFSGTRRNIGQFWVLRSAPCRESQSVVRSRSSSAVSSWEISQVTVSAASRFSPSSSPCSSFLPRRTPQPTRLHMLQRTRLSTKQLQQMKSSLIWPTSWMIRTQSSKLSCWICLQMLTRTS